MDQTPVWINQNLDREILLNLQKILQHLIAFETSFNEYRAWHAEESAATRREMTQHSENQVNAVNQVKDEVTAVKNLIDAENTRMSSYRTTVTNWLNRHD